MATPSNAVPPPRNDGRRFIIPTPAQLRHPRQVPDDQEEHGAQGDVPDYPTDPEPAAATEGAEIGRPRAVPGDSAESSRHPPTPATLPRPSRNAADDAVLPVPAEPTSRGRIFPNPSTLMAPARARKVRAGLRARRLPKVEETSAGGVVLDLSCHPAAVALIARHDRRSRLLWSLPKGHVEPGETPEQAALREVFEETGLVGRVVAPLGIIDFWFVVEDKRIHKTVHHFVIEAIGGQLSDEDYEVEAVEWIPFDQVVRRLAYGDERRLVEKVAQIVPGVK